jgi:hypothetical protein
VCIDHFERTSAATGCTCYPVYKTSGTVCTADPGVCGNPGTCDDSGTCSSQSYTPGATCGDATPCNDAPVCVAGNYDCPAAIPNSDASTCTSPAVNDSQCGQYACSSGACTVVPTGTGCTTGNLSSDAAQCNLDQCNSDANPVCESVSKDLTNKITCTPATPVTCNTGMCVAGSTAGALSACTASDPVDGPSSDCFAGDGGISIASTFCSEPLCVSGSCQSVPIAGNYQEPCGAAGDFCREYTYCLADGTCGEIDTADPPVCVLKPAPPAPGRRNFF